MSFVKWTLIGLILLPVAETMVFILVVLVCGVAWLGSSPGDVRVSLANVELLTIRIRLLVCSVDKAEQIGLNWWKYDPHLTMQAPIVPALAEEPRRAVRPPAGKKRRARRR